MPPKRNPEAPNRAEATPTYSRPSSIASVVEAVNINPIDMRIRIVINSYIIRLSTKLRDRNCNTAITNALVAPKIVAFDSLLNFKQSAAPRPIPNAFTPKIKENISSE